MTQAYYQFPKSVMKLNLSSDAKIILMELIDKHKLSSLPANAKNFTDENGVPFVRVSRATMATWIGRSLVTVRKSINELIKAGLLLQKRLGLTKCNLYYLSTSLRDWLKTLALSTDRKPSAPQGTNQSPSNNNNSLKIDSMGHGRPQNTNTNRSSASNERAYRDGAGQAYYIDPTTGEKYTYGGSTTTSKYRQRYCSLDELNSLVREI